MRTGKNGNVHWNGGRVRLVQSHTEVSLARQQQQDEHANVHEAHASCGKESMNRSVEDVPQTHWRALTLVGA